MSFRGTFKPSELSAEAEIALELGDSAELVHDHEVAVVVAVERLRIYSSSRSLAPR